MRAFACLGVWGAGNAQQSHHGASLSANQSPLYPLPHPTMSIPPTERQEAIDKENRRLLGQMLAVMDRDPNGAEGVSGK